MLEQVCLELLATDQLFRRDQSPGHRRIQLAQPWFQLDPPLVHQWPDHLQRSLSAFYFAERAEESGVGMVVDFGEPEVQGNTDKGDLSGL